MNEIREGLDSPANQLGRKLRSKVQELLELINEVSDSEHQFEEDFLDDLETMRRMLVMAMGDLDQHIQMSFDEFTECLRRHHV